jgi:hypothetical protein
MQFYLFPNVEYLRHFRMKPTYIPYVRVIFLSRYLFEKQSNTRVVHMYH